MKEVLSIDHQSDGVADNDQVIKKPTLTLNEAAIETIVKSVKDSEGRPPSLVMVNDQSTSHVI